jgi:hypothetical protein
MTQAQEEVFERVSELLREHFEGSLVCVVDETSEGKLTTLQYNGGLLQAIGMACAAEAKMIAHQNASIVWRSEEEED